MRTMWSVKYRPKPGFARMSARCCGETGFGLRVTRNAIVGHPSNAKEEKSRPFRRKRPLADPPGAAAAAVTLARIRRASADRRAEQRLSVGLT